MNFCVGFICTNWSFFDAAGGIIFTLMQHCDVGIIAKVWLASHPYILGLWNFTELICFIVDKTDLLLYLVVHQRNWNEKNYHENLFKLSNYKIAKLTWIWSVLSSPSIFADVFLKSLMHWLFAPHHLPFVIIQTIWWWCSCCGGCCCFLQIYKQLKQKIK